eukprot:3696389-Amphidinium_carterae.1
MANAVTGTLGLDGIPDGCPGARPTYMLIMNYFPKGILGSAHRRGRKRQYPSEGVESGRHVGLGGPGSTVNMQPYLNAS